MINETKTKEMILNFDTTNRVLLDGKALKILDDFKYLGSMMKSSVSNFNVRRLKAWGALKQMNKIWKAKNVPLNLKVRTLDASVISILLYG